MTKYYRVLDDFSIDDRWHLRAPVGAGCHELDARDFIACHRYDGEFPLSVPLRRSGAPLNFTLGDFDMPVVDTKVMSVLRECAAENIQGIPVTVENTDKQYWILNVLRSHNCVDEKNSVFMVWKSEDGRPDKTGQYRMFAKLVVNGDGSEPIFRIEGWKTALIVSECVKDELIGSECTGVKFEAVN